MKRICILISFSFVCMFCHAQNNNELFTELTSVITPVDGGDTGVAFGVQFGWLHSVNDSYKIGAGLGVIEPKEFETSPTIPIFMRNQFYLTKSKVSPYINFDLGYQLNTEDFEYGNVFINPGLGINISSYYINVGYLGSYGTYSGAEWANALNISLGKNISVKKNSAFARFVKKSVIGFEFSYDIPVNKFNVTEENTGYSYESGNAHAWSIDFHWLYKFSEQFHAGLVLGYNNSEYEFKSSDSGETSSTSSSSINILARGEYFFKEEGKVIPYTSLDLGSAFGCVAVSPQIGIRLNNHWRIAAAYTYANKYYNFQDTNHAGHLIDAKIGFDF